jgi:hypothetical protein
MEIYGDISIRDALSSPSTSPAARRLIASQKHLNSQSWKSCTSRYGTRQSSKTITEASLNISMTLHTESHSAPHQLSGILSNCAAIWRQGEVHNLIPASVSPRERKVKSRSSKRSGVVTLGRMVLRAWVRSSPPILFACKSAKMAVRASKS